MEKKVVSFYEVPGFGFPVEIINAPMVKVHGEWILDIDQIDLERKVASAVAMKPVRLTGNEIKFLRHHLDMTLKEFAKKFDVTHPAVLKWERAGHHVPDMKWTTEKDIRLFILSNAVKPVQFFAVYQLLEEKKPAKKQKVSLDWEKAA